MKEKRNRLMYFASFDEKAWEVLGVDNDDLSKELNPDVETGKNVIGEATFKHSGYQPEVSVDPYYADTDSPLYDKLLKAAMEELFGEEDIKGFFVEAHFTDATPTTLTGEGFKRAAWIVPQSDGGDTGGLGIPFKTNPVGPMTSVSVVYTIADRSVTITPKATNG